jgi:hypothetical protein
MVARMGPGLARRRRPCRSTTILGFRPGKIILLDRFWILGFLDRQLNFEVLLKLLNVLADQLGIILDGLLINLVLVVVELVLQVFEARPQDIQMPPGNLAGPD